MLIFLSFASTFVDWWENIIVKLTYGIMLNSISVFNGLWTRALVKIRNWARSAEPLMRFASEPQ